jgi:hypothetical protein
MSHLPGNPRNLGILAGLLLLASAPSALAQVTVDQGGVAAPCGTGALAPCALLADGIAAAVAGDTITVGSGTYAEAGMVIDFDLTIEAAAGGAIPIIDAGGADRHFLIIGTQANPLASVTLRGLTLVNGLRPNGRGGAIRASFVDDLTIADTVFTDNTANDGGAIGASGTNLTITGSEFRDNLAAQFGGAIFFNAQANGTQLTIKRTLLKDNQADDGGAVFKRSGELQSIENTFNGNTAGDQATTGHGGAIKSEDDSTLVQRSTFKNNSAEFFGTGGAIDASGGFANDLEIVNSTFFGNQSTSSEGAAVQVGGSSTALIRFSTFKDNSAPGTVGSPATVTNHGTVEIKGTIIAGSAAGLGADCDGTGSFTGSSNLIDGACFGIPGEFTPVTGLAATLALNGGPTKTLMLNANSNAVDAFASLPFIPCGPPFDQRRSQRPASGGANLCDIGAVEAF